MPSTAALTVLLELGALGYIKGILNNLAELERKAPSCSAVTSELRDLATRFQLQQYTTRLKELMRDATAHSAQ